MFLRFFLNCRDEKLILCVFAINFYTFEIKNIKLKKTNAKISEGVFFFFYAVQPLWSSLGNADKNIPINIKVTPKMRKNKGIK